MRSRPDRTWLTLRKRLVLAAWQVRLSTQQRKSGEAPKPQVDDGKLRVLGNCGAQRIASVPDMPTFQELGYKDVEMYLWAGLFAQSALPAPIAARLREAMAQVMTSPDVLKAFETSGSLIAYQDAPAFAQFIAADSARLIAAVKRIGKVE